MDRLATTAILILPASRYGAGPMSYSRKHCDLAPYHITPGGPQIPGDPRERLLHLDGDFSRLDLKWLGLRDYEWLVLGDRERLALSDTNLWIGDTHGYFGGRVAPQQRNAPGSQKDPRADGYRTNS